MHYAWLRLGAGATQRWEGREHFSDAAAQAMRHILIECAQRPTRVRHGGDLERMDVDELDIAARLEDDHLRLIHSALDELATLASEKT